MNMRPDLKLAHCQNQFRGLRVKYGRHLARARTTAKCEQNATGRAMTDLDARAARVTAITEANFGKVHSREGEIMIVEVPA